MRKVRSTCVFKRDNGIFYFRRAVPQDLVKCVGKREWKFSLKTTDLARAQLNAIPLWERTERQIALLRNGAEATPIVDGKTPASDSEVIDLARALFSRRATISIGRLDGRIGRGSIRGNAARDKLRALEEELERLEVSSPLVDEHDMVRALLPDIAARTHRTIDPDGPLGIQIRKIQWQLWKDVLRTNIAQVKGDDATVAMMTSARRTEPTVQSLIELFKKHRTVDWSPKTLAKFNAVSAVLCNILGGDRKLSSIDRQVAREVGDILHDLPPKYSKRKDLQGLSVRDAAERGRELGLPCLGRKTILDYFNHISSVFEFAVHEELMDRNPMKGLKVRAEMSTSRRLPFSNDDLAKIFNAPIFTGCVDDERRWRTAARTRVKRGRYWVPLIALHTGMRLNEVCSLRKGDIQLEDGITFINVTDSGGRRLKTRNAVRKIPIHPGLDQLGFVDWVSNRFTLDDEDLFPELPQDESGSRSNMFSKWFVQLRRSVGVSEDGKTFHSFRHFFEDLLRQANVSLENNERIMGWGNSHIQRHYGNGPSLEKLFEDIRAVDMSVVSLDHLK